MTKENQAKTHNILGIIGNNGKTAVSEMIRHCYQLLEISPVVLNVETFLKENHLHSYENKAKDVIIEVRTEDILNKNASRTPFNTLIFTNSQYKATISKQWQMKRPFIRLSQKEKAILNVDDEWSSSCIAVCIGQVLTYGIKNEASVMAKNIKCAWGHSTFDLFYSGEYVHTVNLPYMGMYHIYNALATYAYFITLGYAPIRMAQLLEGEPIQSLQFDTFTTANQVTIVFEKGSNPEGVEAVLTNMGAVTTGNIISVVEAGAEVDKKTRQALGDVTCAKSKFAIFTTADAKKSVAQILLYDMIEKTVWQNYRLVMDREKAIEIALKQGKPQDVIVIFSGREHQTTGRDKITTQHLIQKFNI